MLGLREGSLCSHGTCCEARVRLDAALGFSSVRIQAEARNTEGLGGFLRRRWVNVDRLM